VRKALRKDSKGRRRARSVLGSDVVSFDQRWKDGGRGEEFSERVGPLYVQEDVWLIVRVGWGVDRLVVGCRSEGCG